MRFTGLRNFAPEILRRRAGRIRPRPNGCKEGLDDLSEEGVIRCFYPEIGAQWIVGVVGQPQLDVLISRLEARIRRPPCSEACALC